MSEKILKKVEHILNVLQNMKIELFVIACSIVFIIMNSFDNSITKLFLCEFQKYFTDGRISGLSDFFSTTVAIYIAVLTILATSIIGISEDVLRSKTDGPLIYVFMFGMIENLLVIAFGLFIPRHFEYYYLFLATFTLMAICSFAKFVHLLILIFRSNMDRMAESIDRQKRNETDMISLLENIARYLKDKR